MFFKSILMFLTILIITKSWAYLAFDTKAISEEKPKDPIDLIPIKCGVECLLKCLNENSHFEYGCFDKCSIACTIPRVTEKNLGFESKILDENADQLSKKNSNWEQIKHKTLGEFCVFCYGKVPYCKICASASELEKSYKIGDLCPYKPPSGPGLCLATNPDTNPICILCRALQPHD